MPDLGIGEFLAGSLLADAVGTTAATGLVDAGIGAGLGATEAGITGGNPLTGAVTGGITGGVMGGVAPALGEALGSVTAGDALAGAARGALSGAVTGGNVLTNTLTGAASGGITGALSGVGDVTTSGTTGNASTSTGGASGATSAPAGVAGGGDVTSGLQTYAEYPGQTAGGTSLNTSAGAAGSDTGSFASGGQTLANSSGALQTAGPDTTISSALSSSSPARMTELPSGGGSSYTGGLAGGSSSPISGGGNVSGNNVGGNVSGDNGGGNISGNDVGAKGSTGENSIVKAYNDPSFSNIGSALGKNAGILTSLGGLATNVIGGMSKVKGESQLIDNAEQLKNLGMTNTSYLSSGTLPAGAQAGINQATHAAIAAIKSRYAAMGMSGSSAESEEIANAQTTAQVNGTKLAMQLMQQGANELQMSSAIYENIMKDTMTSDSKFASAFTTLARAVGGSAGDTTSKTGGQG